MGSNISLKTVTSIYSTIIEIISTHVWEELYIEELGIIYFNIYMDIYNAHNLLIGHGSTVIVDESLFSHDENHQ